MANSVYLIVGVVCGRQLSYGLAESGQMEVKFCLLWGIHALLARVRQAKNPLKISQSIGFRHGNSAQPQKKIKEMSSSTVMSGHIVRYLVYVRVCYLLLGWW